ncbi:MAG: START domain-containing protein [Candidatus Cyclobacteriaceae bacterium M2_1C_046]
MAKLLFILLFCPLISFAQENWELKKEKDGIKVFMREIDRSPFKQIMVQLTCRSTLEQYQKMILDVSIHRQWVYSSNTLELIERVNKNELIYYTEFSLPWPASNRDVTTHLRLIKDSIPNTVFVKSKAVTGYAPLKYENVRITTSSALWKVERLNEEEIQIQYILTLDPAGSLPPWVVNLTATKGPFNSFSSLKEILEENF